MPKRKAKGPAKRTGQPRRAAMSRKPSQAKAPVQPQAQGVEGAEPFLMRRIIEGFALLVIASTLVAILVAGGLPMIVAIVEMVLTDAASPVAVQSFVSVLLFGTMLLLGAIGGFASGLNPFAPGKHRPLVLAAVGGFAGIFVVAFAASYAGLSGGLEPHGLGSTSLLVFLLALAITLLQTGAEEVFFRGWLQPALAQRWGVAPAILASSLSFCLLHFTAGVDSLVSVLNLFLGGLLFGVLAAWGRGILGAVAAHFAWNTTEMHILGVYPNPGESVYGALLDFDLVGAKIWGGSAMGLNASVSLSLGLAMVIVPLVLLVRKSVFKGLSPDRP